jgi:hypothetical protein
MTPIRIVVATRPPTALECFIAGFRKGQARRAGHLH